MFDLMYRRKGITEDEPEEQGEMELVVKSPTEKPIEKLPSLEHRVESTIPRISSATVAERPTLYDAHLHFKAPMPRPGFGYERIIGEDHLGIILTLAVAGDLCWGIHGKSGSSKTLHMNKLLGLIEDPYVTSQASESALFEDCDKINVASYLIFTELQKVAISQKRAKNGKILESLKDLGEGRAAAFKKIVGGKVEEKVLNPTPWGYCLATNNGWVPDAEFQRRAIVLYTSNAPELREAVNRRMYENMHKIWTNLVEAESLQARLKQYMSMVRQQPNVIIFDPYADCLQDVIPDTGDSTCRIPHYQNLVMASAKFNMPDRLRFTVGEHTYVMPELEDHFTVYSTYHDSLMKVLHNLASPEEQERFEDLKKPDWEEWFMKGVGFLNTHPDAQLIREKLPKYVQAHSDKQIQDGRIMTLDFLTGEKKAIGDYGGLYVGPC